MPRRKELKQHLDFWKRPNAGTTGAWAGNWSCLPSKRKPAPGLVIYHPKGALLRSLIENFERREHLKRGYQMVMGPQLLKADLWKRSGHWDNYRDNMYFTEVEGQSYGIKPMNCLAHMLIYKSKIRSYRDLPLRYFELGTVLRHERSGVLHGLTRVRQFTQDDAHILCMPGAGGKRNPGGAQVRGRGHGDFRVRLRGGAVDPAGEIHRHRRRVGTGHQRPHRGAQDLEALPYDICAGEGAFYGPKIDIKLKDALDRRWQCATIQCDFTLPERFDLTYVGPDGERHRPVMLHRVILGSLERFMGVLIEHYAGAFPVWLAPVQAILLPITDRTHAYAQEVAGLLREADVRVEVDTRQETLRYKIREAQGQKIPYMVIMGDREAADRTLAPRLRDGTELKGVSLEDFIKRLQEESRTPSPANPS